MSSILTYLKKKAGDINYAIVNAQINSISGPVAKILQNNFIIVIAFILLIVFISLALSTAKHSYNACIYKQSVVSVVLCAICVTIIFLMLLLYCASSLLSPDFIEFYKNVRTPLLTLSVLIVGGIYLSLIFQCQDPIACEGCSSADYTAFNSLVVDQVNNSSVVTELYTYYNEQMQPRQTIAYCANMYDATYQTAPTCANIAVPPTCNTSIDGTGAPVLAEFFIMSSYNTCYVQKLSQSYMTDSMIDVVLTAGARFLDFHIQQLDFKKYSIPIVTSQSTVDNTMYQFNYVTLENCFKRIVTNYLTVGAARITDPLFINLSIAKNITKGTLDNVAKMIIYYFTEYAGKNYLLNGDYNYKYMNIGNTPICLLFNKVIICVSTAKTLPLSLDELVNINWNHNYTREYTWLGCRDIPSPKDLVQWNRKKLTYVIPTQNIYTTSTTSTGNLTSQSTGIQEQDSMDQLVLGGLLPTNNDPTVVLSFGCQFVALNFENIDANMVKYLSLFKKTSYVLKPKSLRRKPLKLTDVITHADGSTSQIACDKNDNIQNVQQQNSYCSSVQSQAQTLADQQINEETKQAMNRTKTNQPFSLTRNPYEIT